MTVDVARVVADASKVDRAGVYVPMTRGRVSNVLYLAESSGLHDDCSWRRCAIPADARWAPNGQ